MNAFDKRERVRQGQTHGWCENPRKEDKQKATKRRSLFNPPKTNTQLAMSDTTSNAKPAADKIVGGPETIGDANAAIDTPSNARSGISVDKGA